jgi:hypothetical protein
MLALNTLVDYVALNTPVDNVEQTFRILSTIPHSQLAISYEHLAVQTAMQAAAHQQLTTE